MPAGLYTPQSLGINASTTGGNFENGAWYSGRQFWNGTLSDPGVIHPESDQQGAGQLVSPDVNAQSAAAQGQTPAQLEAYLQSQRDLQAKQNVQPMTGSGSMIGAGGAGAMTGGGSVIGGGLGGTPLGGTATPALNLPDLYTSLTKSEGIDQTQQNITDKTTAFNDAQSKINDNPFLSEGNRVGRVAKLTTDYNNSVKNDQDALAMKQQDVKTQLDIATQQFNIDSQSAKASLDQFNTLLQSGALSGASGADIAAITAATGISSSEVQAAINAQSQKDVKTSVQTIDDGKNIYSVVLNSQTGEIISKQVLGASKPAAAKTPTAADTQQYYENALRSDVAAGKSVPQIFATYSGYLDPNTIMDLYNANSKYGPAKESQDQLAGYGVKFPAANPLAGLSGS